MLESSAKNKGKQLLQKQAFFSKIWLAFRVGHSVYFAFILQFANFVIIAHTFLFEKLWQVSMPIFVAIFIATYLPAAIIIGAFHVRRQYLIESKVSFEQNPVSAQLALLQLKMLQGKATKEEVDAMIAYLENIAQKGNGKI